ncbi:pancreatic triacylglycerol lipase isoform X2 [Hyalella azteca]|nr:pancreatic triacylglycerol lipase isoform X3 [Hyalella azteca]XP_047739510.1 pancreatic triacylglycerol lipase isoform X2 [Hyalella azteca]
MLHTRADRAADHDVFVVAGDASTIEASTFDASKPTKFIIHGFIDTGNTYWLPELANAFLDYMDCNVFRVNWGDGSLPMYSQAAANTRVVGLEIGYLVNWLIDTYGVKAADVHLLGHSLGSHVSGYAGEQIQGLGRISGLDPAGPYYTSMPPVVRLDPTDALFVDNIHTDADSIFLLGYGTGQPMGHLDFYPNSGHDQPGCDPISIAIDAITPDDVGDIRDIGACSHCRSIFLYEATLTTDNCDFLGHTCYSYDSFELGECRSCGADNSKCAYMGIRADEYVSKQNINTMAYLDTDDDEEPFCLEHYVVTLLTAYPDGAESWVVGHLTATLYGDTGAVLKDVKISDEHRRIDHGQETSFLIESHVHLGTILRAEFTWKYDDQLLRPGTYCWSLICNRSLYVQSFEVSPINYYPESTRLQHTQLLCASGGAVTEIKDGKTVSVAPTGSCTPVV